MDQGTTGLSMTAHYKLQSLFDVFGLKGMHDNKSAQKDLLVSLIVEHSACKFEAYKKYSYAVQNKQVIRCSVIGCDCPKCDVKKESGIVSTIINLLALSEYFSDTECRSLLMEAQAKIDSIKGLTALVNPSLGSPSGN